MSVNDDASDLNVMEVDNSPSQSNNSQVQPAENATTSSSSSSSTESPHQQLINLNKQRVKFQEITMKEFWEQITTEMGKIDSSSTDFSEQEISVPIMQSLIRNEAIHLQIRDIEVDRSAGCALSKVCEIFVLEMAMRSNLSRQVSLQNGPIKKEDVIAAIRDFELYDLFAEHL